jgi:hypothetical protein
VGSSVRLPRSPAARRPGGLPVLGVGMLLAVAGCRYQNLNAEGVVSAAPFSDLQCFEEGNPEGFSFEIPACECAAGLRLRYVARYLDGHSDIHYEFITGFRAVDPEAVITMVSRPGHGVVRLYLGRRELPCYEASVGLDREQWELARQSFDEIWRNYQPVLEHAFQVCAEDRLERETAARVDP